MSFKFLNIGAFRFYILLKVFKSKNLQKNLEKTVEKGGKKRQLGKLGFKSKKLQKILEKSSKKLRPSKLVLKAEQLWRRRVFRKKINKRFKIFKLGPKIRRKNKFYKYRALIYTRKKKTFSKSRISYRDLHREKYIKKQNKKLKFKMFLLRVKEILFNLYSFNCVLNVKSVFKNRVISKFIKKITKKIHKKSARWLKKYDYYRDLVLLFGVAFLHCSSDLVATYVSTIVERHRNLLKHLGNVRRILNFYSKSLFDRTSALKIGIFGKIMGEKSKRFRRYIISCGKKMSLRTLRYKLNYSVVKTSNVYGGFGIKV